MLNCNAMEALKARIENGEIVVTEPTLLPEGAEVELHILPGAGMMSEEQRRDLQAKLEEGAQALELGDKSSLDDFIDEIEELDRQDTD